VVKLQLAPDPRAGRRPRRAPGQRWVLPL